MNKPEKKNSSFLVSEQYQEFECDALVVHSGNKISEGKIIQAVNGAITDGKHASTFIDYGATIGKSYRALGTLHPKKQAGTFGLITHDVIPATIQER